MGANDDSCVSFTPTQYISIYYSRLQDNNLIVNDTVNALCLLQMRTIGWQNKDLDKCNYSNQ